MSGSNTVRTAPGRPFTKGDSRINRNGQRSKDAVAFGAAFSRALVKHGSADELAALLWEKALRGQPWAAEMILERLLGKVSQPVSGDFKVDGKLIIEVIQTK